MQKQRFRFVFFSGGTLHNGLFPERSPGFCSIAIKFALHISSLHCIESIAPLATYMHRVFSPLPITAQQGPRREHRRMG